MKPCSYCRRENDDTTEFCPQCGTPCGPTIPPGHSLGVSTGTLRVPDALTGGVAVILICAGVALVMPQAFPAIYALSLFLTAWMFVLAISALALTLYAGTISCRTARGRVAFTVMVMAGLALGWPLWFPGESSLADRRAYSSPVCAGAAILMLVGALTLVWMARRTGRRQIRTVAGRAPAGKLATPVGTRGSPEEPFAEPTFRIAGVLGVVAGFLFLSFLVFLLWLYSSPHR